MIIVLQKSIKGARFQALLHLDTDKMKVSVTFFLLCALVGINQAHFETIYGEIENHEYIGNKTAQIAGDSGTALVSKKFTFPSVRKFLLKTLVIRNSCD